MKIHNRCVIRSQKSPETQKHYDGSNLSPHCGQIFCLLGPRQKDPLRLSRTDLQLSSTHRIINAKGESLRQASLNVMQGSDDRKAFFLILPHLGTCSWISKLRNPETICGKPKMCALRISRTYHLFPSVTETYYGTARYVLINSGAPSTLQPVNWGVANSKVVQVVDTTCAVRTSLNVSDMRNPAKQTVGILILMFICAMSVAFEALRCLS